MLGGILLLIASTIYKAVTGESMYNTPFFGGNGGTALEILTYHTLALGFIATALKSTGGKMTKKRSAEIFNTGVTTVSTYLIQGVFGLAITIVAALIVEDFFPAAGILLPFGYGQGTGQALNYGNIYETDYGFVGGQKFRAQHRGARLSEREHRRRNSSEYSPAEKETQHRFCEGKGGLFKRGAVGRGYPHE